MRSIGKEPLIIEEGSRVEEDCILYEHTNTNCSAKTTKEKRRKIKREKRSTLRGKKQKTTPSSYAQYDDEERTWGNELVIDNDWMKAKSHKRLRIMHMNANGITSVQQGYLEWETLLQSMDNSQVDIFCLNETNVDTKQSEVRFQLRDLAKRQDIHTHLKFNSSKQSSRTNKSIFKPGGTLVGIRGNWSGRAQIKKKDKYADKLNRWTVTHLNGKK